jgi:hypothetical protein
MRAAVLVCVVLLCSADAAQADMVADCNQARDPRLRLRACSVGVRVEREGSRLSHRGNARADAGANAEALADFDHAVTLSADEAAGNAENNQTKALFRSRVHSLENDGGDHGGDRVLVRYRS